ncbi:hypothetical protein [uncultured Pseudacidovorax sp.]|uniref:hypothetical protein n=1 Tax=uncultured Pseudacidovorax sp. TaxID=679313 RepID=UPI0025EABB8D|nr:hypothetical protein [uncultured Pseudacidovorax sp.]
MTERPQREGGDTDRRAVRAGGRLMEVLSASVDRGRCDDPSDPVRHFWQLWSKDGRLLVEGDTGTIDMYTSNAGPELLRLTRELAATRARLEQLVTSQAAEEVLSLPMASIAVCPCQRRDCTPQSADEAVPQFMQKGVRPVGVCSVSPCAEVFSGATCEPVGHEVATRDDGKLGSQEPDAGEPGRIGIGPAAGDETLNLVKRDEFAGIAPVVHFSSPLSVRLLEVIEVQAEVGAGTADNPFRRVTQYWSKEGVLLADTDDGGLNIAVDMRGFWLMRLTAQLAAARAELAALRPNGPDAPGGGHH